MNNERTIQRRVGYVVIATGVIGTMLVAANTSGPFGWTRGEYEINILLDSAPGVGVNTPVQKDGVLVGRVNSVKPTDNGQVMVTVSISKEWKIYNTDLVRVQPSSILGDAVVTFTSPPRKKPESTGPDVNTLNPEASTVPVQFTALAQTVPPPAVATPQDPPQVAVPRREIKPGETITGVVVPSPVDLLINIQADVGPAIASLARAGDEVANLADRINQALGENIEGRRIPELLDKTSLAMDNFSKTMENIDKIVGDAQNREQIKATLDNASKLVAEARGTIADMQKTMQSVDSAVGSLDRNMKNIEGLTEPIGKRGPELADLLISSLENFDVVMADMKKFTYALNSSDGTVGRLLNDPTFVNNLNQTICNANFVLKNLNDRINQVEPILADLRAFSDKIGREPGRLVTGGLNPSRTK